MLPSSLLFTRAPVSRHLAATIRFLSRHRCRQHPGNEAVHYPLNRGVSSPPSEPPALIHSGREEHPWQGGRP